MIYIKKDSQFKDSFIVLDENDNPITGLISGDFTKKLYNPDNNEVSGTITVGIEEVESGIYRTSFTPNKLGNWTILMEHTTYFPWGKGENYICVESLNDDLFTLVKRILGLSQENCRTFNPQYDRNSNIIKSILRIYSSASDCDNNNNPIAEYQMDATFNLRTNKMTDYQVKRIS